MITLYTWTTPNGRKASIGLEEAGLAYEVRPVNIGKNEQFAPEFLKVSPNNKIPAIVDRDVKGDPLAVFESGAILIYLAEKSGRLLPTSGPARFKTLEWLFWQVGGPGPMLGQLGFFAVRSKEKSKLAIDRFTDESDRLLGVMDKGWRRPSIWAAANSPSPTSRPIPGPWPRRLFWAKYWPTA
jgi:GST-like protein